MYCFSVFAGNDGCTMNTFGTPPIIDGNAKSRIGIVVELLAEARGRDGVRTDVAENERIAVGRRFRRVFGRHVARGARPVFDDHRGAPKLAQRLTDHARGRVDTAAGHVADHDAHGLGRIILRERGAGKEQG